MVNSGDIFAIISLMFWVDLLGWWYGAGFKDLGTKFSSLFESTSDFFSIGLLAKSLFQPFRQTLTVSNYKRTLGEKIADALVSRTVGFLVRACLIVAGSIALMIEIIAMGIIYVVWPVVPLLPVLMVGLTIFNFGF